MTIINLCMKLSDCKNSQCRYIVFCRELGIPAQRQKKLITNPEFMSMFELPCIHPRLVDMLFEAQRLTKLQLIS